MVVLKPFGKGKVLFFGSLFDPFSAMGFSRFPYFPYYLKNSLGISFNLRSNNLEFYFDPGCGRIRVGRPWSAGGRRAG